MSYSRFGYADVYVYLDVHGYLSCCGCWLNHPGDFADTATLLRHLEDHKSAGHIVHDSTIESLKEDAEENDSWIEQVEDGMCSSCNGDGLCQCQHWSTPGSDHAGRKCVYCAKGACPSCHGLGGKEEWAARKAVESVYPENTSG